jgi:hypothetical protein
MIDPTPDPAGALPQPPRLLDQLRQAALVHFGRPEPGQRFADFARRFILFHNKRHPREMGLPEVARAERRRISFHTIFTIWRPERGRI